jgi:hypothetical protein
MPYHLPDAELLAQCREESCRSSGPGGQHMQKTASAVRLTHLPSGTVVQCQDHRERARNRSDALQALRLQLALRIRGAGKPSDLDAHRRGRQLVLGANATSYPLVVGCLLDALACSNGSLAEAASCVGISTSQLTRLLTADKAVHQAANALRTAVGLGPMHA